LIAADPFIRTGAHWVDHGTRVASDLFEGVSRPPKRFQRRKKESTTSQYNKLYTPQDVPVAFIDHQPQMTFGVANIDRATFINNVVLLAKATKELGAMIGYAVFISAFLVFTFRIVRRGPTESPAHAEASGSLKNALRPHVLDSPTRLVNSHIA